MILKKIRRYRKRILLALFISIVTQIGHAMMCRSAQLLMRLAPVSVQQFFAPLTMQLSAVKMAAMAQNLLSQQATKKIVIENSLPQWVFTIKDSLIVKEPLAHLACISSAEQNVQNAIKNHIQNMHEASVARNALREERIAATIAEQCAQNVQNINYELKIRQDATFREEQLNTFEYALNQLWATIGSDPIAQQTALCTLNFITNLEGRLGQMYANTLHRLNQLAFHADGSPKDLTEYNKKAPQIIASMLEYVCGKGDYIDKLTRAQQQGARGLRKFIDRAHQGKPITASDFLLEKPKASNLQKAICKSSYTLDVLTVNSLCRTGNLDQAQAYINTQVHKASLSLCNQIYAASYRTLYNEYGIARIYERDPLFSSMSLSEKQACIRNPELQKRINDTLQMRVLCKAELEKLFNIPAQHSEQVALFLYDLVPYSDNHQGMLHCLSTLHNDNALCPLFFNSQGIVKIWEQHLPTGLQVPINLNEPSNAELRTLTNLALLLECTKQNRLHINQCIKYVHAATVTEGRARDFYTLCAKATFKALIDPQSNQVMLHCPDLTARYSKPEQMAVHNFIAQRIEKALQLVDAHAIEKFFKDELYALKQAYKYNSHPSSSSAVHEQFSLFLNRLSDNSTSLVNRELYHLFFNSRGILKTFEQRALLFQAVLPQGLNNARNADLRFITHLLLATEPTEQNIPHIQQGFRYLCAAGSAQDNKRATYRYFAAAIQTALANPASNQIIVYAPDCSHIFDTAEKNAVQDQIIKQIYAGLQLVDKQQIADFIQNNIPKLQQLYSDITRGYFNLTQNFIAVAIAQNEDSSPSDSQSANVHGAMQSPMPNPEDPQDPREQEDIDDDEYDEADVDYVEKDDFSQEKIAVYAQALAHVPGADKLLQIVKNYALYGGNAGMQNNAHGALFELETAYSLLREGQMIEGINMHVPAEVDVVTNTRLIECKNVKKWNKSSIERLQNQLGERRAIAKNINKSLEAHFKKPIPKTLIRWLNKQGIKFVRHYIKG